MIDRHSEVWVAVAAHCKAEIEKQRNTLESRDDPEARGRIKALRDLLQMADPPTVRVNMDEARRAEYSMRDEVAEF
jgi:hypothetical protein